MEVGIDYCFLGIHVSHALAIDSLTSSVSVSFILHEPDRSEIFFPFLLWRIRYFIASSIDTGRFLLICNSPAIAHNSEYVSLLIFTALSSVVTSQHRW